MYLLSIIDLRVVMAMPVSPPLYWEWCVCVCVCVCAYMYMYIKKGKEKERERERDDTHVHVYVMYNIMFFSRWLYGSSCLTILHTHSQNTTRISASMKTSRASINHVFLVCIVHSTPYSSS